MYRRNAAWSLASVLATLLVGCGDDSNDRLLDSGADDLGAVDVPETDLGVADAGARDAGMDVAPDRGAPADVASDTPADAPATDAPATDVLPADRAVLDASADGATDAGAADVVAVDVGGADAASARGTPVIDGVIGGDWPAGAIVVTNAVPSAWGPTLNALRSLRVAWDADRLYLGLDGVVEASNAMLVFVDRDYLPGMPATGVAAISSLTDGVGSLDNAISCNVTEAPPGFGTDMVWGTRGMLSKTAVGTHADIGLRDVSCAACRGDFRWTPGDTAVCVGGAAPACEVAIEWSALYGGAPPPVPRLGLFVRITNAAGDSLANNQSLPEQGPGDPPTVARRVLALGPDP